MSNNALNSKGFKWSLGSLATLIGLLLAATPYLNLVAKSEAHEAQIKELQGNFREDHDALVRLGSDVAYIKEAVKEIKGLIQNSR